VETPDLFELFVRPLNRAGLRYMISGSLASVHYGEPRLTMDVDLVMHISEPDLPQFARAFPAADYYVPPVEVMTVEIARPTRGHFNLIHFATGQKADIYPSPRHPCWSWAWEHRRRARIGDDDVYFAPPEYVILWKLEFFREGGGDKHLRDIRGMLLVNRSSIDLERVEQTAAKLGLSAQWREAQAF